MQVRASYEGLRKARLDGFMDGFNIISLKLKEMYQMITLGGDSELELVDTLDPFSEVIWGQPQWCHMSNADLRAGSTLACNARKLSSRMQNSW